MERLIEAFVGSADVGHLALIGSLGFAFWQIRTLHEALGDAERRFDAFVRELARFNARFPGRDGP